ncbi:MAG: hypothetical protein ACK56I_14360 [bacterium]
MVATLLVADGIGEAGFELRDGVIGGGASVAEEVTQGTTGERHQQNEAGGDRETSEQQFFHGRTPGICVTSTSEAIHPTRCRGWRSGVLTLDGGGFRKEFGENF